MDTSGAQAPEIFDTSYGGHNDREKSQQNANCTRGGAHREIIGRINKTVI